MKMPRLCTPAFDRGNFRPDYYFFGNGPVVSWASES
jgi:hypothetical protein